jgi:hypothetical protein
VDVQEGQIQIADQRHRLASSPLRRLSPYTGLISAVIRYVGLFTVQRAGDTP